MKNLIKKAVQYAKSNPEQTKKFANKAMTTIKGRSSGQQKKSTNNTTQK